MSDRNKTQERPKHSIEPNDNAKAEGGNHEVDPPTQRTDDEGGGDNPKTTQREE